MLGTPAVLTSILIIVLPRLVSLLLQLFRTLRLNSPAYRLSTTSALILRIYRTHNCSQYSANCAASRQPSYHSGNTLYVLISPS